MPDLRKRQRQTRVRQPTLGMSEHMGGKVGTSSLWQETRQLFAMCGKSRNCCSRDQPMNSSRARHDSATRPEPSNASHRPCSSVARHTASCGQQAVPEPIMLIQGHVELVALVSHDRTDLNTTQQHIGHVTGLPAWLTKSQSADISPDHHPQR